MFGGMIEKEVDKVLDAIPNLPEKFKLQVSEKKIVVFVMIFTQES